MRLLLLLCICFSLTGVMASADTIVLRSQRVIHGEVIKRDNKGLWVKMAGLPEGVFFPYSKLDPKHAPVKKIIVEEKLDGENTESVDKNDVMMADENDDKSKKSMLMFPRSTITIKKMLMKNGQKLSGIVVREDHTKTYLNLGHSKIALLSKNIESSTDAQIPVETMLFGKTLYLWLIKHKAPKTAKAHFTLAEALSRMGLKDESLLHYQRARVMGGNQGMKTQTALREQKAAVSAKNESDPLAGILALIQQKKYDRAKKALLSRLDKEGDAGLKTRIGSMLKGLEAKMAVRAESEVVRLYYRKFESLLKKRVRKKNKFVVDLAYVRVSLKEDVEDALMKKESISRKELRDFWDARPTSGAARQASFGSLSWMYRLLKGVEFESGLDVQRQKLIDAKRKPEIDEKVKKVMKSRAEKAMAASIRTGIKEAIASEKAYASANAQAQWKRMKSATRAEILRAFAATVLMNTVKMEKVVCPGCGGLGTNKKFNTNFSMENKSRRKRVVYSAAEGSGGKSTKTTKGKATSNACTLCLAEKTFRIIYYR